MDMQDRATLSRASRVTVPWFPAARHAVIGAADAISDLFRRVRAYNDLSRMDSRTLRDIGCRRADLNRIIEGRPPRVYREDP